MDLVQMSFSASVLIVAILVVRVLTLQRLPKKTFLVLWGFAVLRLLVPFSIPSRFSFYTGIDLAKRVFAQRTAGLSPAGTAGVPDPANLPGAGGSVGAAAASVSPIEVVWLAGMCACVLFFAVAYLKCRRAFRMSLPVENEAAARWLREHPLRRSVQIRQNGRIRAPLTYGVFRPVILFPKETDWTDETKLRYILTHEFTHIRRFDALAKLVLTAAVCVHWFNPFVWAMYGLANRDIELSCDETVVRTFGETVKSDYALTLIGLEEKRGRLAPLVSNFSKNVMEERIVSIMKFKKFSAFCIVGAIFLVVGVTTVFATSYQGSRPNISLPEKYDRQYISELEQGHHTGDLDPQNVLMTYISEKKYNFNDFKLQLNEDMKKTYVYPDGNIEIQLVAYDIETSNGDVVKVWNAQQYLYRGF